MGIRINIGIGTVIFDLHPIGIAVNRGQFFSRTKANVRILGCYCSRILNQVGFRKDRESVVPNTSSPLIAKLSALAQTDADKAKRIASYVYKLSLLSQKKFSAEEMQTFMKDSFDILLEL